MSEQQVTEQQVTVYSTPNCMQCRMTYRALDAAELPYRVVDLTQDDAAREWVTEDLGYSQAPVVVVDDDNHWSGFQPDQIKRVAAAIGAQREDPPPQRLSQPVPTLPPPPTTDRGPGSVLRAAATLR